MKTLRLCWYAVVAGVVACPSCAPRPAAVGVPARATAMFMASSAKAAGLTFSAAISWKDAPPVHVPPLHQLPPPQPQMPADSWCCDTGEQWWPAVQWQSPAAVAGMPWPTFWSVQ